MEVKFFTIELQGYYGKIVGRLQFINANKEREESALYNLEELTNVIYNWRNNQLVGSFAIGTTLAKDVGFQLVQKG